MIVDVSCFAALNDVADSGLSYTCMLANLFICELVQFIQPQDLKDFHLFCAPDLIFGDETGVLCIPASKIQNVLEKAEEIQREEAKILEKLTR